MATLADSKAAWLQQYGYSGSISDMEYQYYSNPPVLNSLGFVRVASSPVNSVIPSINSCTQYHRVIEGGTFTKIRIGIGVASGNICAAVYKNIGSGLSAKPGTRIATSGSIPCPAAGDVDIAMGSSVTVSAGDWLSLGADNTVATFAGTNGPGASYLVGGTGSFMFELIYPAPATANPNPPANNRMFAMIGIP